MISCSGILSVTAHSLSFSCSEQVLLQAVRNILKSGKDRLDASGSNPYLLAFEQCGGIDAVKLLQVSITQHIRRVFLSHHNFPPNLDSLLCCPRAPAVESFIALLLNPLAARQIPESHASCPRHSGELYWCRKHQRRGARSCIHRCTIWVLVFSNFLISFTIWISFFGIFFIYFTIWISVICFFFFCPNIPFGSLSGPACIFLRAIYIVAVLSVRSLRLQVMRALLPATLMAMPACRLLQWSYWALGTWLSACVFVSFISISIFLFGFGYQVRKWRTDFPFFENDS